MLVSLFSHRFSKEIVEKNPKLVFEFTIKDEHGRDKNAIGASIILSTCCKRCPRGVMRANARVLRRNVTCAMQV
jgi:hypothetical protein